MCLRPPRPYAMSCPTKISGSHPKRHAACIMVHEIEGPLQSPVRLTPNLSSSHWLAGCTSIPTLGPRQAATASQCVTGSNTNGTSPRSTPSKCSWKFGYPPSNDITRSGLNPIFSNSRLVVWVAITSARPLALSSSGNCWWSDGPAATSKAGTPLKASKPSTTLPARLRAGRLRSTFSCHCLAKWYVVA